MTPHKSSSSLGVYGQEKSEQWQKWAVLIASVLFAGVAFWGIANAIVTFPEAIAEYDSQYAEVTGQK